MMKKKIVFIINPISGGINKDGFEAIILKSFLATDFECTFCYTQYHLHAKALAQTAVANEVDIVVAIGGDGTINEVASQLVNTNVALAVIPTGSGNGLARHLAIPLNLRKAIALLKKGKIENIDVGEINGRYFFCTSGVGFDAEVAHRFAAMPKRGFWNYIKSVTIAYFGYQPEIYQLRTSTKEVDEKALLITFANASQFGNNAHIAPLADIKDGLLDVSILRPIHWWEIPYLSYLLFAKKLHKSNFIKTIKTADIQVSRATSSIAHIDGEPAVLSQGLKVRILVNGLKVVVG